MADEQEGVEYTATCSTCGVQEVSKKPDIPNGWGQVILTAVLTGLCIAKKAGDGPLSQENRTLEDNFVFTSSFCPKCIPALDAHAIDIPGVTVALGKPKPSPRRPRKTWEPASGTN